MSSNWNKTTTAETGKKGALSQTDCASWRVIETFDILARLLIITTNFDPQCPLPYCRQKNLWREQFGYLIGQAQTSEPGDSKNDRIIFALLQLAQSGIDIATQLD